MEAHNPRWLPVLLLVLLGVPFTGALLSNTDGSEAEPATVLHCGRLLDIRDGKLLSEQSLVVAKGEVQEIVNGYRQLSEDEQLVDLREHTCLPGLIDLHTHLSSQLSPASYSEAFRFSQGDYAFRMVGYAEKTLMAGFTTVRDLGDRYNLTVALKRAIAQGLVTGPRIFTAAKSIATTGGHADPTNGWRPDLMGSPGPAEGVANGEAAARQAVRQRYKDGADLIKITATGGVLSVAASGLNPQFMEDEVRAIVETARDYGFTVAAHAHGIEGMKRAVRAGVTTIEHGTFMDDETMQLMREHGTVYVPTMLAGAFVAEKAKIDGYFPEIVRPKAASIGPKMRDTVSRAWKAGVTFGFGTDSGVSPHGGNAREFVLMVEAGVPPLEAIRSATQTAARVLRQEERLGTLEVGKVADVVAVPGDPLEDISRMLEVAFVMKDGNIVKHQR